MLIKRSARTATLFFNRGRVLSSKTVIAKSAIVLFVVSGFRQWKP